jgi:hypothetical protein
MHSDADSSSHTRDLFLFMLGRIYACILYVYSYIVHSVHFITWVYINVTSHSEVRASSLQSTYSHIIYSAINCLMSAILSERWKAIAMYNPTLVHIYVRVYV